MTAADRPTVTDDARAEAMSRYSFGTYHGQMVQWHDAKKLAVDAFIAGAEWAAGRAETTTATTEGMAGIDRAEVRRVLENEFWPFLAHDPHDPDRFWGLAVDAVMGLLATARARPTAPAELLPAESIALTVALAQVRRGDEPDPNTAAMCVLALARLAGRHDWTEAAA